MVTVKDIARYAAVSLGTVDRVIHRRGRVAPETEARVVDAIETLGYRPNMHARNLSHGRVFSIDLVMPKPESDGGYWNQPLRGIDRAIGRLSMNNIELRRRFFDRYEESSFFDYVHSLEAAASSGSTRTPGESGSDSAPDGILIAPVVSLDAQARFAAGANTLSVPVVAFDSRLGGLDGTFVGQDPVQGGRVAARLIQMHQKSRGVVVSVTLGTSDPHLLQRAAGFRDFWRSTGTGSLEDLEELEEVVLDKHVETASVRRLSAAIRPIIERLQGVFVTNAAIQVAVDALEQAGCDRRIPVVGYDLLDTNVELLRDGRVTAIISQQPELQGYEAAHMLSRHLVFGAELEGEVLMPVEIVLAENLASFVSE